MNDDVCDYCARQGVLQDVGMGCLLCRRCRSQIEDSTRSGLFSFSDLVDFIFLPKAHTSSGLPVAVGITTAPYANFWPAEESRSGRKRWWERYRFWYRDRPSMPDRLSAIAELLAPAETEDVAH